MKIDLNSKWQSWLMIGGVTVILFGMSWLSVSTETFFLTDTGLRFIQIQALVDNQGQSFAIDYPFRSIDPAFRYVPYYRVYLVINDQVFLSLSPFFNLLSAGFYAAWGSIGLTIVPVLGAIFTALAGYQLATLGRLPAPHCFFLATIFATPIWFYSLEVWDHTLGTALTTWAVYLVAWGLDTSSSRLIFLGGIVLGLATGQRPEIYTFAIALGLALLVASKWQWRYAFLATGGGIIGAIPLWILQYNWFGHPLGPVVGKRMGYGSLESYLYQGRSVGRLIETGRLVTLVEAGDVISFMAAILSVIGLLLIILGLNSRRWQQPGLFKLAGLLTVAGYLIFIYLGLNGILSGLLPTFPLIALAVTYRPPPNTRQLYQFVYLTTGLFLGLMVLLWPAYGGPQWGARYLLPSYPLMIYLAGQIYVTYRHTLPANLQPVFSMTATTLLILTVVLQLIGVGRLYEIHYEQIPKLAATRQLPANTIITNNPYFPSSMAAATEKDFIYVGYDPTDFQTVLLGLAEQGSEPVMILSSIETPLDIPSTIGNFKIEQIGPAMYKFEPLP